MPNTPAVAALPGLSGNFFSTDDINLLDSDTAHQAQSMGELKFNGGVGDWGDHGYAPMGGKSTLVDMVMDSTGKVTVNTPANSPYSVVVTPGVEYSVALWLERLTTAAPTLSLYLTWWRADETYISDVHVFTGEWPTDDNGGGWISGSAVAPAEAAFVTFVTNHDGLAGETWRYAAGMIAEGSDPTFVPSNRIANLDIGFTAKSDWGVGTDGMITNREGNYGYWLTTISSGIRFYRGTGDALPGITRTWELLGIAPNDILDYRAVCDSGELIKWWVNGEALPQSGTFSGPWPYDGTPLCVGERPTLGNAFEGDYFGAFVRDGEDGPATSVFDPQDIVDAHGGGLLSDGDQWQDETGRTWTAHGAAIDVWGPPTVTPVQGNYEIIDAGNPYEDQGASAVDCQGVDISGSIVVGGDKVQTEVPGLYAVTYTATDGRGFEATTTLYVAVADAPVPEHYFIGGEGRFYADDINLLDADTAHLHQSKGAWENGGAWDPSELLNGFGSWKVEGTGANIAPRTSVIGSPAVEGGKTYTVSTMVKATVETPLTRATIYWYDSEDAFISASQGAMGTVTTEWTQFFVTAVAPANAVKAMIRVESSPLAAGVDRWHSNTIIREGSDPTFDPSLKLRSGITMESLLAPDQWLGATESLITKFSYNTAGWRLLLNTTAPYYSIGTDEGMAAASLGVQSQLFDGIPALFSLRRSAADGIANSYLNGELAAMGGAQRAGSPMNDSPNVLNFSMGAPGIYSSWAVKDGADEDAPPVAALAASEFAEQFESGVPIPIGTTFVDPRGRTWQTSHDDLLLWRDPLIGLIGHETIWLEIGDTWVDPGAAAYDANDVDISADIQVTGSVNTAAVSVNHVTYTITDSRGRYRSKTRTVIVAASVTKRYKVTSDGSGRFTTDDINLLDSDTAHMFQSRGGWDRGGLVADAEAWSGSALEEVWGSSGAFFWQILGDRPQVEAGVVYSWGAGFKVVSGLASVNRMRVYTQWQDEEGNGVGSSSYGSYVDASDEYVQVGQVTAAVPAGATRALCRLTVEMNDAGPATFRVKDACFREGTDPTFLPSLRVVGNTTLAVKVAAERIADIGASDAPIAMYEGLNPVMRLMRIGPSGALYGGQWVNNDNEQTVYDGSTILPDQDPHVLSFERNAETGRMDMLLDSAAILGYDRAALPGKVPVTPVPLSVGAYWQGGAPFTGDLYYGYQMDGIESSVYTAIFHADDIFAQTGLVEGDTIPDGTTWVDSTGRTWTAHGIGMTLEADKIGDAALTSVIFRQGKMTAISPAATARLTKHIA